MSQETICLHKFLIEVEGEYGEVANITDFNPEFSGNMETYSPMEAMGQSVSERTGVDFKIGMTAKRTRGNKYNDAIAACALKVLDEVKFNCKWIDPDGMTFEFKGVINTTKIAGGASKDLSTLEFEVYPAEIIEITQGEAPAYIED